MITINIYYRGDDAISFMNEMEASGIADAIRKKDGCLRYDYFIPTKEENCVLLIDSWKNQQAMLLIFQQMLSIGTAHRLIAGSATLQ